MKNNENEIYEQNQGSFPAIQVGLHCKTTDSGTQNASFCNVERPKLYNKIAETSHSKSATHPLLMHKPLTIKRQNAKKSQSNNATISCPTTYKTLYKTREFAENHSPILLHAKYKATFVRFIPKQNNAKDAVF